MTPRRKQEGTSMLPSNLHVPEDCRAVSDVLSGKSKGQAAVAQLATNLARIKGSGW